MANPRAREDAERTSSASLRQCVRNLQRRPGNKSVRTWARQRKAHGFCSPVVIQGLKATLLRTRAAVARPSNVRAEMEGLTEGAVLGYVASEDPSWGVHRSDSLWQA